MYDNILVPTDGSKGAEAALVEAFELAAGADATVHALYVADTSFDPVAGYANVVDAFDEVGQKVTNKAKARGRERDVEVRTAVMQGAPHREILAYADEHDVDLIIMGTHGRTGLERHLLGSTTEKVVRTSAIPVLTVREPNGDASDEIGDVDANGDASDE